LNEPAFIANIRDSGVRDLDDARRYIETGPRASYAAHGFGLWLMQAKETGEPVGICGILRREGLDEPDLGFALRQRSWGRGYAREAAAATLAYVRDVLGLGRILAITAPHNLASARVLEAVGFQDEGMITMPGPKESRLFVWTG
jgi:RimJ/RimL family protein N-acetyltransferase